MQQPDNNAPWVVTDSRPPAQIAPPRPPPYPRTTPRQKRPWLCVLLSVFLPGCGVIAAGSLGFGLAYAILFIALVVTAVVAGVGGLFAMVFFGLDAASKSISRDFEVAVSMVAFYTSPLVLILAVAPWLASVLHAGIAASEWNRRHTSPAVHPERQREPR